MAKAKKAAPQEVVRKPVTFARARNAIKLPRYVKAIMAGVPKEQGNAFKKLMIDAIVNASKAPAKVKKEADGSLINDGAATAV